MALEYKNPFKTFFGSLICYVKPFSLPAKLSFISVQDVSYLPVVLSQVMLMPELLEKFQSWHNICYMYNDQMVVQDSEETRQKNFAPILSARVNHAKFHGSKGPELFISTLILMHKRNKGS